MKISKQYAGVRDIAVRGYTRVGNLLRGQMSYAYRCLSSIGSMVYKLQASLWHTSVFVQRNFKVEFIIPNSLGIAISGK